MGNRVEFFQWVKGVGGWENEGDGEGRPVASQRMYERYGACAEGEVRSAVRARDGGRCHDDHGGDGGARQRAFPRFSAPTLSPLTPSTRRRRPSFRGKRLCAPPGEERREFAASTASRIPAMYNVHIILTYIYIIYNLYVLNIYSKYTYKNAETGCHESTVERVTKGFKIRDGIPLSTRRDARSMGWIIFYNQNGTIKRTGSLKSCKSIQYKRVDGSNRSKLFSIDINPIFCWL